MNKSMIRSLLSAALLLLIAAQPVAAQISERDVLRQRVTLDPAKGYVFLRASGRLAGTFLRVPDEEALAVYRRQRAEAMAEERVRYVRLMERWQERVEAGRVDPNDKAPTEPTEENFGFSFIAVSAREFGPDYIYDHDESDALRYTYLTALPPGRYIWYGPVFEEPNLGYMGMCYCMGTVAFDVAPGVITDLGNYLTAAPQFQNHAAVPLERSTFGRFSMPERSSDVRYGLPPSLASWPSRQTEFQAVGKLNNFFGVRISRLAPIPGVLDYRGDVVIDERTGAELAPLVLH